MSGAGARLITALWGKVLDCMDAYLARPDPPDPRSLAEIVKLLESAQKALGDAGAPSLRVVHAVPRPAREEEGGTIRGLRPEPPPKGIIPFGNLVIRGG